jgi:hypothetical protein
MGLFSSVLGNADETDASEIENELDELLCDGENVEVAFKIFRDIITFTNKRMLLVDKQGITGKKKEFESIPYRSISHFSIETNGHFDDDSELKIYLSNITEPRVIEFKKGDGIIEVQKILASNI